MNAQLEFMPDLYRNPTGDSLKAAGMDRALSHADAVRREWSRIAEGFLVFFISDSPWRGDFKAEDFIAWSTSKGLSEPPSPNAWGGVISRAARKGMIELRGYAKSKHITAHSRITNVWRAK
jgi:hypothetical protein